MTGNAAGSAGVNYRWIAVCAAVSFVAGVLIDGLVGASFAQHLGSRIVVLTLDVDVSGIIGLIIMFGAFAQLAGRDLMEVIRNVG